MYTRQQGSSSGEDLVTWTKERKRTHPQQTIHDPRLQNEQQRPLDAGAMIPRVADVRFHVLAVVPVDVEWSALLDAQATLQSLARGG